MDWLKRIAFILVIIGAINWGLIGLFQFDLVAAIFGGQQAMLSRIIYTLVGLSGLYLFIALFADLFEEDGEVQPRVDNTVNYGTEFSEELDLTERDVFNDKEGD